MEMSFGALKADQFLIPVVGETHLLVPESIQARALACVLNIPYAVYAAPVKLYVISTMVQMNSLKDSANRCRKRSKISVGEEQQILNSHPRLDSYQQAPQSYIRNRADKPLRHPMTTLQMARYIFSVTAL